jgi:hypothetical protein
MKTAVLFQPRGSWRRLVAALCSQNGYGDTCGNPVTMAAQPLKWAYLLLPMYNENKVAIKASH